VGAFEVPATTRKLGRYQIVKHLAQGGMADVLLARTTGIEGFERHVVIKRIRAEQARDHRYVDMFLDEARLAASLHHHNIVPVNDIGEEDGEYFFAMEYVHGEDVRALLSQLSKRGEHVPLEHAITIVTAAAAGLHHAHEQRGPDRSPLGIVHRDVSPANILIGYDGGVKVADFGIAKAAHRTTQTRSGTLKGKVAYMSPEQCVGEAVDRRSDVFSLGIVLYELVTVRRLFKGENDFLTMASLVLGHVPPPSKYRTDLPAELEEIILKALANKPHDRFATADEMRLALENVAAMLGLRTSSTTLADYVKQLFGERPEPWLDDEDEVELEVEVDFDGSASGVVQAPLDAIAELAIPTGSPEATPIPIARAHKRAVTAGRPPSRRATVPMHAGSLPPHDAPEVRSDPPLDHPAPGSPPEPAPPGRRRWWVAGALAAVAVIGVALAVVVPHGPGDELRTVKHAAPALQPRREPPPAPIAARAAEPATAPPVIIREPPPPRSVAPTPAKQVKKPIRNARPVPPAKPEPKKHWDPNSLFPED